MSQKNFPKVLLVGSFSWYAANGITVHNLFSMWPKGSLSILSTNIDDVTNIYSENIQDYYIMGLEDTKIRSPYGLLFNLSPSKIFRFESKVDFMEQFQRVDDKPSRPKKRQRIIVLINEIRFKLIHLLGLGISLKRRILSQGLKKFITDFSPNVIYCTSSNIDDLELAIMLKKNFPKAKLIFHTFDDFVHSIYEDTFFPCYWKIKLQLKFKELVEVADFNFTISQKMADEYKLKFKKEFYAFHNPIDLIFWRTDLDAVKSKREFTILYTGKVNQDTGKAIQFFYNALSQIALDGIILRFKIFSPYDIAIIRVFLGNNAENIVIEKFDYNELPTKMSEADALLLALNNDKRTYKYIRLSMLTKATEYMATRKPIILFAPNNIAVTEYLLENKAAYGIDSSLPCDQVSREIKKFIEDKSLQDQLVNNAYNLCETRHTIEKNTVRLLELMNSE